ncbi:MAG: AMP-binding protein, partial [Myxococcales bacterium]|nr:AMP-binding protein [Myxococcales bacterium]
MLRERARAEPDRLVYTHLRDGERDEVSVNFAQLWDRSRALGEFLRARGLVDQRVLLLYPPGLDYAEALFACFIAGVIAVPEGPPDPRRPERNMARLRAVARDARIAAVLTVAATLPARAVDPAAFTDVDWIATDTLEGLPSTEPELPPSDALAYLQYTSGSTATPRGVMLSHQNLAANCAAIEQTYATGPDSVMVSWVPSFHDLGLVYGVAMPVWSGFRAVSLAAADFARRPLRWLQAIDSYRGTHSIAPDSAYAITAAKVRLAEARGLDLSSWETALNGAEPIRARTIDRFTEVFAQFGWRRTSMHPAYGLAEFTLAAVAKVRGSTPVERDVDALALTRGALVEARAGGQSRRLVSSGRAAPSTGVAIVDPATGR